MQIAWSNLPGVMLQTSLDSLCVPGYDQFIESLETAFSMQFNREALDHAETFGDVLVLLSDIVE